MVEKFKEVKASILSELPQIPFVIDQVDGAIDWCIEAHDKGVTARILNTAADVAKYVKTISDPNFYKTHLVIASLIGDIDNVLKDEKFSMYKTASHAVEDTIKKITIDPKLTEERGCFNALNIWLTQLAREDENSFVVVLYGILNNLKEIVTGLKEVSAKAPITPQDYITILGYAYVMSNLRMANLKLLDRTRVVINEIEVLLNNEVIY